MITSKGENIGDHQQTVKALLSYGKKLEEWAQPVEKISKLRGSTANAFLLGVMLDRSILAERSWEAANWINDAIGDPDNVRGLWVNLKNLEKRRLEGFLRYGYGGKAFHRHYKTFAEQLPKASVLLLEKYEGDPRKIWNSKRDVSNVRDRLEEIPGIGPALSRMAVLILARNYGLLGGKEAFPQIDIKPDVHVMRVFKRVGFISAKSKEGDAIAAARDLYKKFPAALDAPSFKIGQEWCRPVRRQCEDCPIGKVCPQINQ